MAEMDWPEVVPGAGDEVRTALLLAMTLLVGTVQAQASKTFVVTELPNPAAKTVQIHAMIPRPEGSAREEAAWRVLARTLTRVSTRTYSNWELFEYEGPGTQPLRVEWLPDFIRLEIGTTPANWQQKFEVIVSLLSEVKWEVEEPILQARAELMAERKDPWGWALDPFAPAYDQVRPRDVVLVYQAAFQPGKARVFVNGPIEPGTAQGLLDSRVRWSDLPAPPRPFFVSEIKRPEGNGSGVSSFELAPPPIRLSGAGSAAQFLAAIALGAGKDCTLWRVLREEKAWTYRTEMVFWPTKFGLEPRLLMLRGVQGEELPMMFEMAEAIRGDLKNWDAATLARAKVMARSILTRPSPFACIYLHPARALGSGEADAAAWQSFWGAVGEPPISIPRWVEVLENVELEEFKTQATIMTENLRPRLTSGR